MPLLLGSYVANLHSLSSFPPSHFLPPFYLLLLPLPTFLPPTPFFSPFSLLPNQKAGDVPKRGYLLPSSNCHLISMLAFFFFSRDSTDALLDLAFASPNISPAVSQKALLTLGAVARSLGKTDQQLANEITHTLHSALEQHTGQ